MPRHFSERREKRGEYLTYGYVVPSRVARLNREREDEVTDKVENCGGKDSEIQRDEDNIYESEGSLCIGKRRGRAEYGESEIVGGGGQSGMARVISRIAIHSHLARYLPLGYIASNSICLAPFF